MGKGRAISCTAVVLRPAVNLPINLHQRSHLPPRPLRGGQGVIPHNLRRVDPKRLRRHDRIAGYRYVIAPHVDALSTVAGPWGLPLRAGALPDVQAVLAAVDRVAQDSDATAPALGGDGDRIAGYVA